MNAVLIDCDESWAHDINQIVNHTIATSCAIYDIQPRPIESTVAWLHARREARLPVKGLIDESGTFVGYGSFAVFRPFEAYVTSVEHSIYVHHEHRGLGYGRQLLLSLIDVAKDQKRHCMIGGIDSHNVASIRLHQQNGFQLCAEIKQVARKFDRWLDLHFYQLILDP